jgi:hypothetical protein
LLVILLTLGATPGRAAERDYVLRWIPGTGAPASGFRVYLAPDGVPFASFLDLGPVAVDQDGVARSVLTLDSETTYRVAMTAYNGAGESALSNEIRIAALTCTGCDDTNACTADACVDASCSHTAVPDGTSCNGSGICRSGGCGPAECLAAGDCDDGDVCNGTEACGSGGLCLPGIALDCGPPTQCSESLCDALLGCNAQALPDGTACDDGASATRPDACRSGICVPGPTWTIERSYTLRWIPGEGAPALGYRLYLASDGGPFAAPIELGAVAPGSDGIARSTIALDAFSAYQAALTAYNDAGESEFSNVILIATLSCGAACDDADPCTLDECGPAACNHTLVPDGTACGMGVCLAGSCTMPVCATAADCDDGDLCNGIEECGPFGSCTPGTPLECEAPGQCATAICEAQGGCQSTLLPDGSVCDDGDSGTLEDSCQSGICSGCPLESSRDYTLRWIPSAGAPASGYRVYLSTGTDPFSSGIDLGPVAPGTDGIARAPLALDAWLSYRAAMSAYNQAGESALSNVIEIRALSCADQQQPSAP